MPTQATARILFLRVIGPLAILGATLLAAQPARAQNDVQARLRRYQCAMRYGAADLGGQIMMQRCMQGGGGPAVRPMARVPQLVHPVGPLVGAGSRATRAAGGGDGCRQGYVWREAAPYDHVCVSPATRQQSWNENNMAASRVNQFDHAYGPDTCQGGFVWREATPSDHVCVVPEVRSQARADNAEASSRVAR
jgi:hypothetical protein